MNVKSQTLLPTIAIIGAGNVGTALAQSFIREGYTVAIGTRNPRKARKIITPLNQVITSPEQAVINADINLLAVTDGAIQGVCNSLANHFKPGSIVAHCSGALDSQVLSEALKQKCLICSLHPLNTFPNIDAALKLLSNTSHNTYLYCEGNNEALQCIRVHFERIGFNPVDIRTKAKPLYHAACVFACNYLTTLMDISLQTAEAADLDDDIFWQAIQPLIQTTLQNISQQGTSQALSGPIARGDQKTVKKHLNELGNCSDDLQNIYTTLAIQTIKLAAQNNHLDNKTIDQLMALLKSD